MGNLKIEKGKEIIKKIDRLKGIVNELEIYWSEETKDKNNAYPNYYNSRDDGIGYSIVISHHKIFDSTSFNLLVEDPSSNKRLAKFFKEEIKILEQELENL